MAFKKVSKRKLPKNNVLASNQPTPISIDSMIISTPTGTCYFKRLKYKGCPNTITIGNNYISREFKFLDELIDMQRDDEIRKLYSIFSDWPANASTRNYFYYLCEYIRALDAADRTLNFLEDNVLWYSKELERLMKLEKKQGGISSGSAKNKKSILIKILRSQGKHSLARQLPSTPTRDRSPHPTLDDSNFTAIGKFLHKGYRGYMTVLQTGIPLPICPLFDQNHLVKLNISKDRLTSEKISATLRANPPKGDWRNLLVRIAILLTFMFTGVNAKPLFLLRRCDVKFKKGAGNHYELESVKHRSGEQRQTNELGFTRYSKDFFESWLLATEHWSNDKNALVFPRFRENGEVTSWGNVSPQAPINKVLVIYGLPKVTSSIFRKTRAQMLMRVLNDVHAVADANNNSIETTSKDYLHGTQAQHDLSNAGASDALFKLTQGMDKSQVIADFKEHCKDPLTELEFLKVKQGHPNITRTGLCCWKPSAEKVAKEKIKYRNVNPTLSTCIDFLDCFDCPSHALVAEADNIWMMLSFYDSLRQVMTRPAYNCTPSDKLNYIEIKTLFILSKLKEKAPKAYHDAEELNKSTPHPLYDDDNSIDDLLRIYG